MRLEVALCAVLLTACHKPEDAFKVEFGFEPRPPQPGPLKVSIRITDRSANPIDGAHVELEGDMTHAGMTPVFGFAKALGKGRYQGILQLTMAGDWVVLVHGHLPDGTLLEREIVVK